MLEEPICFIGIVLFTRLGWKLLSFFIFHKNKEINTLPYCLARPTLSSFLSNISGRPKKSRLDFSLLVFIDLFFFLNKWPQHFFPCVCVSKCILCPLLLTICSHKHGAIEALAAHRKFGMLGFCVEFQLMHRSCIPSPNRACWSLSQLSLGERQATAWSGRQPMAGHK